MTEPISSFSALNKGGYSPFRSRSTIICLASLAAFVALFSFAAYAGYFDAGFAAACLLFLRELTANALGHQLQADQVTKGIQQMPPS